MPRPLKVLIVEDNPADAELELLELQRAGFAPDWVRVDTEAAFRAQLPGGFDLVLSDYQMPGFNGLRALELLQQSGLDVPFILVSGTIGEELAVVAMKNGATDYLLKDRLVRLGPAVIHALAENQSRRERRQAEELVQRQQAELRVLFDLMPAMIWFKDTGNRILRVNRLAAAAAGKSIGEIEGQVASEAYPPGTAGDWADDREVIHTGVPKLGVIETRCDAAGESHWIQTDKMPVCDQDGRVTGIFILAQDITQRKQLEEQLRQAQKLEAIGTLAGGIAHDFNNLLAAIGGYTELARMTLTDNPGVREHLDAVIQAVKRAADLVRQILTFSRDQPLERRLIPLPPVVSECVKLLRATIPATIELDLVMAADAPLVFADETQVHQVLMNLGTNARHAIGDRPGRIQLKVESCAVDAAHAAAQSQLQPGRYARVSVSDTGRGMDEETQRRIFEPFFTTKGPGEGTGLGLAVVHGIMRSHDGVITVYSQPGEGTVFHLYFPAHAAAAALAPRAEPTAPRGRGERVLFVDDEELLAKIGGQALRALGYEVEVTRQPAAALELVRADPQRFALVITDQAMPGMTGLQLAAELRRIQPDLPIILTTGYSLTLTAERMNAAGIQQLLLKPTSLQSLGAAVHAAVSGQPVAPPCLASS